MEGQCGGRCLKLEGARPLDQFTGTELETHGGVGQLATPRVIGVLWGSDSDAASVTRADRPHHRRADDRSIPTNAVG